MKIMIFGDSYSTFEGMVPYGYATFYPELDVKTAEDTWWRRFVCKTKYDLIQNNSWSGSTIGYTGYGNSDCSVSSSFIYRYKKLKEEKFFEKNDIDMILVFGGTNDSWSGAPLGEMKFADWEEKDLFNVLPAICYFSYMLKNDMPHSEIVFIINTDIKIEIRDCIKTAAEYYGIKFVLLQNIDKKNEHPSRKGMEQICEQLLNTLTER